MRLIHGADSPWSPEMHRLTDQVDLLRQANWQRGGGKRADRPKPLRRPYAHLADDEDLDDGPDHDEQAHDDGQGTGDPTHHEQDHDEQP